MWSRAARSGGQRRIVRACTTLLTGCDGNIGVFHSVNSWQPFEKNRRPAAVEALRARRRGAVGWLPLLPGQGAGRAEVEPPGTAPPVLEGRQTTRGAWLGRHHAAGADPDYLGTAAICPIIRSGAGPRRRRGLMLGEPVLL